MKIEIQLVTQQDIPEVLDLHQSLYLELGEEKESIAFLDESLIESVLKNGKTQILKASSANKIIGIISISEGQAIYAGGEYGIINDMYVKPEFRSLNIGQQLINKTKKIAAAKGWKRIEVTAPTDGNKRTVQFYEKNRFSFTGPKLKWTV